MAAALQSTDRLAPDELSAWLRLLLTPGVGRTTARRLLAACGGAQDIWSGPPSAWHGLVTAAQAHALQTVPQRLDQLVAATAQWLDQPASGQLHAVLALGHPQYPQALLQTEDPPLLLHVQGSERCMTGPAPWFPYPQSLAEAFVSKTATIAPARIEAMAQRLAHLEQYINEDGMLDEDMPLSPENIEMILGVDTAGLNVIPSTNTAVEPVMLEWAASLETGRWFTLDHNGARIQVQYTWRSRRKQLHLFAALDGTCHLLQLRRMASYLQSGLLAVHDEEALTVRATRDALQKIQANPERLSSP